MHAVAEMIGFSKDAAEAGMTEEELTKLINRLAADPQAGVSHLATPRQP